MRNCGLCRRVAFSLSLLFFSVSSQTWGDKSGTTTSALDDFLRRLEQAEVATMESLDYEYRTNYAYRRKPDADNVGINSESINHTVWQDDKFRIHLFNSETLAHDKDGKSFEELITFDGNLGWALNGGIGNLTRYVPEPGALRSIHGNVLNQELHGKFVSSFLRAPENANVKMYSALADQKEVKGLSCYHVEVSNCASLEERLSRAAQGKKTWVWDYYFRVDNLLPVGVVRSLLGPEGQRVKMLSEIMVTSWQEVEGKVFPHKTEERVYTSTDTIKFTRDSELSIRSLAPRHGDEFFSIEWPLGTTVYELNEPGKIALSYEVGFDKTSAESLSSRESYLKDATNSPPTSPLKDSDPLPGGEQRTSGTENTDAAPGTRNLIVGVAACLVGLTVLLLKIRRAEGGK